MRPLQRLESAIRRRHPVWRALDEPELEEAIRIARRGATLSPYARKQLGAWTVSIVGSLAAIQSGSYFRPYGEWVQFAGLCATIAICYKIAAVPVPERFDFHVVPGAKPSKYLRDLWLCGVRGSDLVRCMAIGSCRALALHALCAAGLMGAIVAVDLLDGAVFRGGRGAALYVAAAAALAAWIARSIRTGAIPASAEIRQVMDEWNCDPGKRMGTVLELRRGLQVSAAILAGVGASVVLYWWFYYTWERVLAACLLALAAALTLVPPKPAAAALGEFERQCTLADFRFEKLMRESEERER